ncbi:ClpP family protease [Humisphaera borealis]|nr:ATP-dependent Clp protease proteolytic subunit [Humisphaera borealis]
MTNLDLTNVDPRVVARLAELESAVKSAGIDPATLTHTPAYAVPQMGIPTSTQMNTRGMPSMIPGRGPVSMPVAMPGPGGGSYNRYREMTIEELLLENRVVFLVGEINHASAYRVIMHLLYLQSVKRDADINFYINSPGGVVDDTLAVYDIMKVLSCQIATYCIGRAESGGAVLFMAGQKGKRFILPNAKVMIHQPYGGVYGQAADIEIQAEQILKDKSSLIKIMAECTGQTMERIQEDSERDRFFDAEAAVKYGLCDEVLGGNDTAAAVTAADGNKPK